MICLVISSRKGEVFLYNSFKRQPLLVKSLQCEQTLTRSFSMMQLSTIFRFSNFIEIRYGNCNSCVSALGTFEVRVYFICDYVEAHKIIGGTV